ncbi:hypothetical protein [Bradyrhizobium canariense]|uniref:hypothetical protein n=1 Tax=Bradyrhizobium canariense TaxID=255045 RepID=UPI001431EE37|nr:hypothetical protein [Bradyrhizobium canariense]
MTRAARLLKFSGIGGETFLEGEPYFFEVNLGTLAPTKIMNMSWRQTDDFF